MGISCLIMSILYAIFKDKGEWQGLLVRNLTSLLLLVFACIVVNLTSTLNAFSLFITIATAISMFYESIQSVKLNDEKAKKLIAGSSKALMYLAFALSVMSLASFNALALLGGGLLGLAVGALVWALKKYNKAQEALPLMFIFFALGLMLGFGVNSILASRHLISSVLSIIASVMFLVSEILQHFLKEGKLKSILCSELKILAIIIFVLSIYLFS